MTTNESSTASPETSTGMLWGGRVLTALPTLALLGSSVGKLTLASGVVDMLGTKLGFSTGSIRLIGALELTFALLFAFPGTAVLGAVLLSAYMGGAESVHLRFEGSLVPAPIVLAAMAWAALYLRDPRVRALLPLRKS